MIDVGTAIRKGYFDIINQQVMYNASIIPLVDEKLDAQVTEHTLYMIIDGQEERTVDNKSRYATEIDLMITIVNRRQATNSKTAVEDVAKQILHLLFPEKNKWAVTVPDPLHLTYARFQGAEYRFEKTDTGFNIIKRMTFRNRITQS